MKKSFKRSLSLCAAGLMLAASLTGCGSKEEETTAATTAADTQAATEVASATEATTESAAGPAYNVPDKFTFDGKFEITITGYEFFDTGDDYEYDLLNVYYDFTMLSDRFATVNSAYWTATQDGEELKVDPSSSADYDNMDHTDDIWLYIQKGVTFHGMQEFSAKKGSTAIITVGVGASSGEYEYFDVDPTWDMPDMRHEKFEIAKISDPAYGPGNLPEGSQPDGKFDVKIVGISGYYTGSDLDVDKNTVEHTVLAIDYEITNHTGKTDDPFMIAMNSNFVFQDGITLKTTSSGKGSPDEGKTQQDLPLYQDIDDGETATVTVNYKVRSDSPIEVMYRDFMTQEIFADMVYELDKSQLK
jgi:hypothetical protein